MMFEDLPFVYFTALPSGVMVLFHQYKEKSRKNGSGLPDSVSVLLSQCCRWHYRSYMLVATDCIAHKVTQVQETLQYFGGCLGLLHIRGCLLLLGVFFIFCSTYCHAIQNCVHLEQIYLVAHVCQWGINNNFHGYLAEVFCLNFFQWKPRLFSTLPVSLNSGNPGTIPRISLFSHIFLCMLSGETCQINSAGCFFTPRWGKKLKKSVGSQLRSKNMLVMGAENKTHARNTETINNVLSCGCLQYGITFFFRIGHLKYVIRRGKKKVKFTQRCLLHKKLEREMGTCDRYLKLLALLR